ncbi:uncharacterized protein (UPF0335 family) [Sphingomonas sp. BE123]|uniref:hypothetical protein n=1 Tax=unclassified Sphingomonas TaxID=196159 RepID=UPI0028617F8E|nr:hypothetical protein [Sphingomonas sp. BE123]MDR6853661.1 uncharacterized protein (UPF0335 family) [Sphingomonas sp. BE123]
MAKTAFQNVYVAEFNRCIGDNIKNVVRRLRAKGYEVSVIRHKTTVLLRRPSGQSFRSFRKDIAALVQDRIGSVVVSSTSGKIWIIDNKGNQAGEMRLITENDL